MGFKRENYTLKGIRMCVYFLILTSVQLSNGQSHCPVRVDYEPREETQSRSANTIQEVKFPFFQQWLDLDKIRLSDEERASVFLPTTKRSTVFKGSNLGFAIPNGATISGIELIVKGHTEGSGSVEGQMVKLLDSTGEAVGSNEANLALPIDKDWIKSEDSTDFIWRYGSPKHNWGLQLTESLINDKAFGYAIQVRNKLNAPVTVFIDHIQMIVYYTPLYEVCSTHACVPFYIDEAEEPLITYEWYIPQGFELISDSENDPAINIGVSYASFGEYEICVESFENQAPSGICCRKFNYINCNPSQISGEVFYDRDNDATNNNGDQGIEAIPINLYSNQGSLVSATSTDGDGRYSFSDLQPGQYYIEVVDAIDSLLFTTPNIGSESNDSDVTGTFGTGTTDLINITNGDTVTSIDAGFILALSIGDFVWEDLNGDGIQQANEPGIEGMPVHLTNFTNAIISTQTNSEGFYHFTGLPPGNYTIDFDFVDDFIPTIPNNTSDHLDSDLTPNMSIHLSYSSGGYKDSIDAGFYRMGSIGDFVWEDLDKDGLQDELEPGISGVILYLKNINGDTLKTTISDSLGNYRFDDIAPGDYFIEIQTDLIYAPTEFGIGSGSSDDINSDVFEQNEKYVSSLLTITSNLMDLTLDFGFVQKPAQVGGFTFLDENNSGQYDSDELFVPNINVYLYKVNNEKIDSTQSDPGGFYLFENLPPGTYYLVFELKEDLLFTTANVGNDLSDSDVSSSISSGSTELFNLQPDEQNFSISAGYQTKPKIGDYIWLDTNGNGIQDTSESGLNEIVVELYNDSNELLQSTTSGPDPESQEAGYYQFHSLIPGNYYIKVPTLELYDFALIDMNATGLNSSITNANGIGTSNTFTLVGNQCNFDIDAGYALKKGNIKGEVWIDVNRNGIQESEDVLKSNVLIELFNEMGERLFFQTSGEDGSYIFSGLDAGNYYIVFTPSEQYQFTDPLVGSDNGLDSDVTGENSAGSTTLLTVVDGVTIEDIDAGLTDGAVTVNGLTWVDENGDGIQQNIEALLSNVKVELYNLNDSLLASEFTDQNGEYQFPNILAGQYYLVFEPESSTFFNTFANQGFDDDVDDDVTSIFTSGSTDTLNIIFFQAMALINAGYYELSSIGDQVFIDLNDNGINDNEAGLDDVIVNLLNASGTIIATDTTAQGSGLDSGYYLLENIPPGTYTVQFTRPLYYQFVAADQGADDNVDSDVAEIVDNTGITKEIAITSGTTDLSIDAGVFFQIPMESSISGIVWYDENTNGIRDNNEPPIFFTSIQLEDEDGEVLDNTVSDVNGLYTFENLSEGFYRIRARNLAPNIGTFPNVGSDDSIDSDFIESADGFVTEIFFLATFETIGNVDLGLVKILNVGDFVWEDLNNNGVQDENETGIEGIEITIISENGIITENTLSDAEGGYQFTGLSAGRYKICTNLPDGFNFAKQNNGIEALDSDVDSSGCTEILDFTAGGTINNIDIGLTKNGSITGVAFIDLNGNGVKNLTDPGLDDVEVSLFSDSGVFLASTITNTVDDIDGIFEFNDIKAADYYLVFDYPEDYIITSPNVGDDLTDSDITGVFGEGSTDIFSISSGEIVNHVNGGAYLPGSIGDQVWIDANKDGIKDVDEAGAANIEVVIFRSFGIPFDTTYTDNEGFYQFGNLKQGLYFVQFVIPQEFTISPRDQGMDDSIDSDADDTGKTPLISLAHGAELESVDCGIYASMASLRSVVWNDSNGDGIRQDQEARIPGIKVSLLDDSGTLMGFTETNSLGLYAFQEIPAGAYKIAIDLTDTDYAITDMNMANDDYLDCDINPSGESDLFSSYIPESILSVPNVDAGLYESGGIISIIWEDENANGLYDLDESPFENIEARLYTKEGILVQNKTSTGEDENLQFHNLPPGEYFIKYLVDPGYVPSPKKGTTLEDDNSDVLRFEGYFISPSFQVLSNEIVSYVDAGFYEGAALSTTIWIDSNLNGIQDDEAEVPEDIYATIYNDQGKSIGTKGVNQQGQIQFYGIPKGKYYIKYYSSSALFFTKHIEGSALNSDVDHSFGVGTTGLYDFDPYMTYAQIDAGLMRVLTAVDAPNELAMPSKEIENRAENIEQNMEENIHFEVYPNPAANYLRIAVENTALEGTITIRNNQNQLIYSARAADIDKIDLSEFHPGIYYVRYTLKDKSLTKKIIKVQ